LANSASKKVAAKKATAKKSAAKAKPKGATPAVAAPPSKATPAWVWALSGVFIGLFVALIAYLQFAPPAATNSAAPTAEESAEPKKKDPPKPAVTQGNSDLEFYKILPELKVNIPQPAAEEIETDLKMVEKPGSYMLQVGSFRRFADADKRKASLAMLGIESAIQKASGKGGGTWHRVRVGPHKDMEQLNDIRVLLHRNQIETMLMKVEEK
jgi:cell division protein FtsN